jgi:hypothetical protein
MSLERIFKSTAYRLGKICLSVYCLSYPPKLELSPGRTCERTVDRPSYNAVGGALKPSVQSSPIDRVSRPWCA